MTQNGEGDAASQQAGTSVHEACDDRIPEHEHCLEYKANNYSGFVTFKYHFQYKKSFSKDLRK